MKLKTFNPDDYKDEKDEFFSEKFPLMRKYYQHPVDMGIDVALVKNELSRMLKNCSTTKLYIMASLSGVIDLKPEEAYIEGCRVYNLPWNDHNAADKDLVDKIATTLSISELVRVYNIANHIDDIEYIDDPEELETSDLNQFLNTINFK